MHRRHLLLAAGCLPLAGVRAQPRTTPAPTPSQMEGPFYPVEPIPIRADLLHRDGRSAQGTPMVFTGTVSRAGAPVPMIKVEIWQCDAQGRYRHPRGGVESMDPGFEGFGAQFTDAQGRYRFLTLYPVPYEPRPPHIHLRVWQGSERLLTTQAYLPGRSNEGGAWGRLGLFSGNREALEMRLSRDDQGRSLARFDIHLG